MIESKWLKWKITHKETGLTFKQYIQKYPVIDNNGYERNVDKNCFPVLLTSGIPAIYVNQEYYPHLFFLRNSDWIIEKK